MELTSHGNVKKLLQLSGQNAKKFLGQNFLIDKNILEIIVKSAEINKDDHVVEVGPGLGVLTQELAKISKKVTTIELDSSLLPILEKTLEGYSNIEVINMDALKFQPPETPYKVVANIPYNITSPLITRFLQRHNPPESMTLLIQLEVAEKICEKEPKMSVLSLQVAMHGTAKITKKVSPTCFYPPPKVTSAILQITTFPPTDQNYITPEESKKILSLAKKAFSQKRKKLSNTLGKSDPEIAKTLQKLGFLEKRPQTLSVQDWKKLAATKI